MKVQITLTLDLGEDFINPKDVDELKWLDFMLWQKRKAIHDNHIGDELGEVLSVDAVSWDLTGEKDWRHIKKKKPTSLH